VTGKLWGGRFEGATDSAANHFHSSISFDRRLFREDIEGSRAHAEMLGRQGIIPMSDADAIAAGLDAVLDDVESGRAVFDESAEDIHMNVEKLLTERIGDAGKRLHTGRSRNDQVALDLRMYVKRRIDEIIGLLAELMAVLNRLAGEHAASLMPGYTHLQPAQPVTLGHHLLAYFEMFRRDAGRFADCRERADVCPLGSGALAGTAYPIDREFVRERLGFAELSRNSLDGVSDRDFVLEFLSAASITMAHLSRFCEEIVLWSSGEFAFVELSDAYSTGSSIMPQKKNPDMAELIRGKTGRVYGGLIAMLTVVKGLPLAYNKDLQEDKESVFDAADTLAACLPVFAGMIGTMTALTGRMAERAGAGFMNATDAADWLVGRGCPFRDAHGIIGRLVLYCAGKGSALEDLTLEEFRAASPLFDESIYAAISPERVVAARDIPGGTAPERVRAAAAENERYLENLRQSAAPEAKRV
jgi:argininosuccinate lyase